ncbi:NucA/NucB deoxyribonuclease domain-containing protein [Streptomyces cinnamoneus]|uniref:NucA/NucB deoxyribonuclease domain-containing protein n=1 Tax=Streptomyces cinnamoneus TaxID=53446 RepID=UPI003F570000
MPKRPRTVARTELSVSALSRPRCIHASSSPPAVTAQTAQAAAHRPRTPLPRLAVPCRVCSTSARRAGHSPWRLRGNDLPGVSYRCDYTFWNRANIRRTLSPGCVFPGFTPTMTTMQALPEIAKNIRGVQARGGHYGKPGSGHPLHREANDATADANRQKVCPRGQTPPRAGLSCDEYPFATTKEGGHNVPAGSRGTAWVHRRPRSPRCTARSRPGCRPA